MQAACWRVPLAALLTMAAFSSELAADLAREAELESKIIAGWQTRQDALDAVYWKVVGSRLYPRGSCNTSAVEPGQIPDRDYPPEDYEIEVQADVWIDFRAQRIRSEFRGEIFNSTYADFLPAHEVRLCDGVHIQEFLPRDANPRPGVEHRVELYDRSQSNVWFFNYVVRPVLKAHGLTHDASPLALIEPPALRGFRIHHEYVSPQGWPMVVLRREQGSTVTEWHVAIDQASAVCETTTYYGGRLAGGYEVQYEAMHPVAMPVQWTLTKFFDGQLMQRDELRVVEYTPNPPLDAVEFHLEAAPGQVVFREATRDAVVIGAPGQGDVPLGQFLAEYDARTRTIRLSLIYGLSAILLLACLALSAWSRSRRAPSDEAAKPCSMRSMTE